jgi:MFS transporter, YNFM family, putative membrane transport protein
MPYRRFTAAMIAVGIATFAHLYCVQPLLPLLAESLTLSPSTSSLSLSVTTLILAGALPLIGPFVERANRRRVLGLALAAAALATLATALSPTWPLLLLARATLGLALAALPATAMAMIAEEVDPAALGRVMGLYLAGTVFGGMSGRVLAGLLADWGGWRGALGGIDAVGLLCLLVFWWCCPAPSGFTPRPIALRPYLTALVRAARDPALRNLALMGGLLMGQFVATYNYLGFRLLAAPFDLEPKTVGLLFLTYIAGMIGTTQGGRWLDRWGARRALPLALALTAAGQIAMLMDHLAPIVVGLAIMTFGFFAAHACLSTMVGRRGGESKGRTVALYLIAYYIGSSLLGAGLGHAWSALGWHGIAGAALTAIGLSALLLRRALPPTSAKADS